MVDTVNATVTPSIPSTVGITDPAAARFCGRLKELLEVKTGVSGDPLDQWVSFRDLYNNGMLVNGVSSGSSVRLPGYTSATLLPPAVGAEFAVPPAVTNFSAVAALANFILSWDRPTYLNHAYTEIWRTGTNDIGTAVLIGTTPTSMYADNVGFTGAARYYWARNISTANVPGPFNATTGTGGTTGMVGNSDLTDLIITSNKIAAGAIDAYSKFGTGIRPPGIGAVLPTLPSATYPAGALFALTTDSKLYRVDPTGNTWTRAVDGADLIANTVTAAAIAAGAIVAGKLAANAIVAGDGVIANAAITNALIGALAVDTANIANGAIVNAKIANLAVDASKIALATITNAQIASATILTANIADANITTLKLAGQSVTFPYILAGSATTLSTSATTILTAAAHTFGDGSNNSSVLVLISIDLQNSSSSQKDDITIALAVDGGAVKTFYSLVDTTWSTAPRTQTFIHKLSLLGSHTLSVTALRSGTTGTLTATATISYQEALR